MLSGAVDDRCSQVDDGLERLFDFSFSSLRLTADMYIWPAASA